MAPSFFFQPILCSPYEYPKRHWQLADDGQPTGQLIEKRRRAEFITPIPKPRKQSGGAVQQSIIFDEGLGLSTAQQQYKATAIINDLRKFVDEWRARPNPTDWQVTPETARLLQHWRHHNFGSYRPFVCQLEAVETAIWLTEVAPESARTRHFIDHLVKVQEEANPELFRIALKLATGAGKTTAMAMLIAWQTVNAARRPSGKQLTCGFLIMAPGLTIRDRLRVLQPNAPDSYYQSRELLSLDMMPPIYKARIIITNHYAFKLREKLELSKGTRALA